MMQAPTSAQTLPSLQAQFQHAVLQDQPAQAALLSPRGTEQFAVYQNAYRARLRAALRDNFEALPQVMGDDAFDALANAYIAAHPSRHYSLRWFGHQLCDFMAANEPLVDHPAMLDLARMEWALRSAFDAADAPVLSTAELAAVPAQDWANLRFTPHPSVQLLPMQWAIGPIWHAIKGGQDELAPPDALAHHMLIWRKGFNTQWKSLTPTEAAFVQNLVAGHNFGHLCETLCQDPGESQAQRTSPDQAASVAVGILQQLLNTGAISALQTQPL